ncbi:MAG: CDP-alcohol phosphatidyltransferase family protein [Terriglobales bacterium]|jgi:phosphatidylglycerophosphate synthase
MMTTAVTTWFDALWKHAKSTRTPGAIGVIEISSGRGKTYGNPNHVREQGSILARAEKAALVWMAQRLPHWVNSDHLTALGFAAMLGAGVAYSLANRHPLALIFVVLALALNWFGDSLDGTLARVRNQLRPRYGFYVDHVLDMVGTFFLLGGLALSGYMNPLLALGMLAAYLTAAAEEFLATHVRRVFHLSFLGFGPTELRVILAVGTLYLLHEPWVRLGSLGVFRLFDVGGVVAIAGLALKLVVSAVRNTRVLYREERLPR